MIIPETSQKEMEEILKVIKKSDYNVVEQLGQTPSKISMLALLLCSEAHAKALIKFLKTAHVPQETSADQFQEYVAILTIDNGLGFSDADLTIKGRKHNDALHVSVECRGTTLAHVLVETGLSLNVLPKKALDRLYCEGLTLNPNNIIVRAFDGSKRMVHGEVDIPIKVGTKTFNSRPSQSRRSKAFFGSTFSDEPVSTRTCAKVVPLHSTETCRVSLCSLPLIVRSASENPRPLSTVRLATHSWNWSTEVSWGTWAVFKNLIKALA